MGPLADIVWGCSSRNCMVHGMSNACAMPAAQAQEWQDKYHKLHERHLSARSEFDKLKHISSERKAKIAALQQQVRCGAEDWEGLLERGQKTSASALRICPLCSGCVSAWDTCCYLRAHLSHCALCWWKAPVPVTAHQRIAP